MLDEIVIKIEKTCEACPSQWTFRTMSGKYGYGRYRFGNLYITMADREEDLYSSYPFFTAAFGDEMEGTLSTSRFVSALKLAGLEFESYD